MNIGQVLKINSLILAKNKIPNPHLDAEILLSFTINKSREYLLAHPEKDIARARVIKYSRLINKRAKSYPIAYLTGHKSFYGLDFFVNKDVPPDLFLRSICGVYRLRVLF